MIRLDTRKFSPIGPRPREGIKCNNNLRIYRRANESDEDFEERKKSYDLNRFCPGQEGITKEAIEEILGIDFDEVFPGEDPKQIFKENQLWR